METLKHPFYMYFGICPNEALPKAGTKAFLLLSILSDGKTHSRESLSRWPQLGETARSPLQKLRSDSFLNWNILSLKVKNESYLQLDNRHLSGDSIQDNLARKERKRNYKGKSHQIALQGNRRLKKAYLELSEAQKHYLLTLGEAANEQ